jgi:hypothetical protein
MPSESDKLAVEALVRAHGNNFITQDRAAQLALWDQAYPGITLMPTERIEPITTWAEIKEYYETVMPNPGGPLKVSMSKWDLSDLTIDFLSEDIAHVTALVDTLYDVTNDEPIPQLFPGYGPQDGKWLGRLTYVARRTDDGWKIIHCEDSSLDMFRAQQLGEYHDSLIKKAVEILDPIVNPPIDSSLIPGSAVYES